MSNGLVLGFFDGVHRAHRAVINSALDYNNDVILITFKDSPAVYFGGNAEYILSRKDSYNKIKNLGVKEIIELDFSKIANMSAREYLEYLIETYKPKSISTGFNHTFGHNKEGNPEFLENNSKKYGYKYICTPPVTENGDIVSSTLIRSLLTDGHIEKANSLLESNFILEGTVIHGKEIGRKIGFPTANIEYTAGIVKIPYGVYYVNILGKRGIMNWGIKPTVNSTKAPVAEVHIFDFDGDLYGKNIRLELIKQIRGEKKFEDLNELKTQIEKDISECLKL